MSRRDVVLVHGAWHASWCWGQWVGPLREAGHRVHTPDLPGHAAGRRGRLNRLRLRDYVDHVRAVVDGCDRPPIVIGHSMGGAVVQLLLTERGEQGLAGAVLLAPVPAVGVLGTTLRIARGVPRDFAAANLTLDLERLVATPAAARAHFFSDDLPDVDVVRHHARLQSESYAAFVDMLLLRRNVTPRPLSIPLLVVAAEDDAVFTVDEVSRTAQAWGTDAVVVPGVAHDVMLDTRQADVLAIVRSWAEDV